MLGATSFSPTDIAMMKEALALARSGWLSVRPNPAVGCVLVKDNQIVGRGAHLRAGTPHAEAIALAQARSHAKGCTAYVTLEPCSHFGRTPPCADALVKAGVSRVVAACQDPNPEVSGRGLTRLHKAGIQTEYGLLEKEARQLNAGFMSRMELGRPYVRCKVAISLDGRTAMADGESQWITGEAARLDGHLLRARAGAILTGSGTLLHDDPQMTVRHPEFKATQLPQPLRVIVDSKLITPLDARIYSIDSPVLVAHAQPNPTLASNDLTTLTRIELADKNGRVDLKRLLHHLANEYTINDVHVEAGAGLTGALLEAELIDELILYVAPILLGDKGLGMATLPNLLQLKDKIHTEVQEMIPIGNDWRITVKPIYSSTEK